MKTFLARLAVALPVNIALIVAIHRFGIDKNIALSVFMGISVWGAVVSLTGTWEKE